MEQVLRILHLEDIESDAELVNRELRRGSLSFELLWVSNKEAFADALINFHPDIILSDHSLPGITSVEALSMVKATGITVPFILITATISEEFAVAIIKNGAADYILKDRMQRLPGAVRSAMEQYHSDVNAKLHLQEIIRNESRFRGLIENSGVLMGLIDADSKMVYRSPNYEQITGWTFEEMRDAGPLAFVHSDDLAQIYRVGNSVAANPGKSIPLCYRFRHKDGNYLWLEGLVTNMLHDEAIRGNVINLRDVTERKIEETELLKSKANFSAIIENTDAYIHSLDTDLNYITFNEPMKRIMKETYGVDLVPGMKVLAFFDANNLKEKKDWEEIYERVLNGEPQQFVKDFSTDLKKVIISFSINPIRENGSVIGISCFSRDITKRYLANEEKANMVDQLIQQNNDLMQFSFIASHNLRGPVASVLGIMNLFNPTEITGESSELLPYLKKSVENIDTVIKDISGILSIRTGEIQVKEWVSISATIADIRYLLQGQINECGVQLLLETADVTFYTIKSYFHSILYNLISNAIKFRSTLRTLKIDIETFTTGTHSGFTVRDNGVGIDLERFGTKIFGLYHRFHLDIEGKGLGLYMVKTQVLALNGTIEVESEVGQGTLFRIQLPLSAAV